MRRRLILWILAVSVAVAGYWVCTLKLRSGLEEAFTQAVGRPVTIRMVNLTLPPGVILTGIRVSPGGDGSQAWLVSAQQVAARLSFLSFLRGQPGFDLELTKPVFFFKRDPRGLWNVAAASGSGTTSIWPESGQRGNVAASPSAAPGGSKASAVALSSLRIRDGKLTFVDGTVAPEVTWDVEGLVVSLRRGPQLIEYNASFAGSLAGASQGKPLGQCEIQLHLIGARTGEAQIRFSHEAIQFFAPYVRPVLGVAAPSGACELKSKITFHDTMLAAENELTARDVVFPTEEPTALGPAGNHLVELLKDSKGEIHLQFVVKGKIGERLDWSDLVSSALREAMRQGVSRSIQKVITDSEELKPVEELIRKGLESLGR